MHVIQGFVSLVARLMIAAIFLASAAGNKIPNFTAVAETMGAAGIQQPKIMLAGAIVFLILGSVSVVVGYYARFGALLLLVFLIAASYYFHAFWKLPAGPEQMTELISFMKNVALMGTMVFIMANGAGAWSIDACRRCSEEPSEPDAAAERA
jgi:putative oxidoreductase